jgi:hypothetical protein
VSRRNNPEEYTEILVAFATSLIITATTFSMVQASHKAIYIRTDHCKPSVSCSAVSLLSIRVSQFRRERNLHASTQDDERLNGNGRVTTQNQRRINSCHCKEIDHALQIDTRSSSAKHIQTSSRTIQMLLLRIRQVCNGGWSLKMGRPLGIAHLTKTFDYIATPLPTAIHFIVLRI